MAKETLQTLAVRGNRLKNRLERIDACITRTKDKDLMATYEKEKKRRLAEMTFIATKIEALQEQ